ncbi:MAG: ABC transporter permease [Mailhella sp.]|nr:ABC transporter permease [Bacteroidales bacterium]MBR6625290.1 ABC transporter permease [Mailhella sp.]MBR6674224.1 ABC transporter permease [Mailhella sp.]
MMKKFLVRLNALTVKEFRQIMRDPSSILIGLILPCVLIFIFGYGLSLDVNNIPVAVVMDKPSPVAQKVFSGLTGSRYFSPCWMSSMQEAEELMRRREVDAILHTASDFDRRLKRGEAEVQLILHGADSTTATLIQQYTAGLLALRMRSELDMGKRPVSPTGSVEVVPRIWFNEAGTSTWYLVPGLVVIIMTLVGAFLTALVMAREWERGTLESLFVTPAGRAEILLSKIIPYFLLGFIGLLLCLAAARWMFGVPMRGSLWLFFLCSSLYLLVALGLGLIISSLTRSQFLASQIALIVSFLPAVILSGFLFDLRSVPTIVRAVGSILPATYFMEILKTLFLAGDNMNIILRNSAALVGYIVLFMAVAAHFTRKKLD